MLKVDRISKSLPVPGVRWSSTLRITSLMIDLGVRAACHPTPLELPACQLLRGYAYNRSDRADPQKRAMPVPRLI